MKFLLRLAITAAALWAAVWLIPGISHAGPWWHLLLVALVFGFVNALIRPLLYMLTCPLIVFTLGLFVLVLNALMLWLTAVLAGALEIAFRVDGFWAAFLGALVVSIVSTLLSVFVGRPLTRDGDT